ncbi:MAG: hypothetical protein ACRD12_08880 [Acidimicrobiales bacterium]
MSTIWTPSGERPIRREPEPEPGAAPTQPRAAPPGDELSDEELAARMIEVQRQLLETPAAVVIANHCIGLFQLAVLHLEQEPPNQQEAKLAIDAMAAIVETLGDRLGEDAPSLRDALAQLRIGYVQRQQMASGQPPAG